MVNDPNRIQTPDGRMSVTVTTDRQTPKTDFGEKLRVTAGIAANAAAQGAAVAAPFIPGGAIISAAVNSVNGLANNASAGAQRGVSGAYLSTSGMMSGALPMTGTSGAGLTGVGTGTLGPAGLATPGNTSVNSNSVNYNPAQGGVESSTMQSAINDFADQSANLLNLQITMAKEVQVFNTVSNVLKTRHDTVKNTIGNVR